MDQQQLIDADIQVTAARSRLTQRLAELERRVVGTTNESMDTLRNASTHVSNVIKETTTEVGATVQSVSSSVCEALDVARQVRAHPWQSLGLAAAAGILVGLMPRRASSVKATAGQPGIGSKLWESMKGELTGLGQSLITNGSAVIKQSLVEMIPHESGTSSERQTAYANGHDLAHNGRRY